nr:DUF1311 domain-containing protein [Pelagibacterium limicola]
MKSLLLLAALVPLAAITPAAAQEDGYTPEEDAAMIRCLDAARAAIDANGESQKSGTSEPQRLEDCIGAVSDPCMDTPEGMTTMGMSECMARETKWWDMLLNTHYAALRSSLDEESFAALRKA